MKRIYHTWDKWECYPSGFYENKHPDGIKHAECVKMYAEFLRDIERFSDALAIVITEWKNSCEHYLSNECMNRIAWLGQAAACEDMRMPSCYRSGFNTLSKEEQVAANECALEYLNKWLVAHGEQAVDLDGAKSKLEVELY